MQTELGAQSKSGHVVARIRGDCSPAQWVPRMLYVYSPIIRLPSHPPPLCPSSPLLFLPPLGFLCGLKLTFFSFSYSCIDQLNHVSAESFRNGGDGSGQKKYGKDGCQNFVVAIAGGKLLG